MNHSNLSVGVVGASGYSGELLVRLLARHPRVSLVAVASRSHAGKKVEEVLPRLRGVLGDLAFCMSDPQELAEMDEVDVWFLALPHGVATEFALPLVGAGRRVIDLSADFRLNDPISYQTYYGSEHPAEEWLKRVPYVLPELADDSWKNSSLIACPGCYPTSILVPLVPLVRNKLVDLNGIVVNSLSGISGAGKKASEMYSFCEREGSLIAYGMIRHRHLAEVEEQLAGAAGVSFPIQFTPHLLPVSRGIFTTIVSQAKGSLDEVYAVWNEIYKEAPAIDLLPAGQSPDIQRVVGRNRVELSAMLDPRTGALLIHSAIDNLMKGASGQAIQILNESQGWASLEGLE